LSHSSISFFGKKKILTPPAPIFSPLFETYSIRLISFPYHIHPYHFSAKISNPARSLSSSPIIMAHTRSQELDSRINTLEAGFLKTQQEVQQLSATIASRDASRDASINASTNASVHVAVQSAMAEVRNKLESVVVSLCTKLKIPLDDSLDDAHKKIEGETSSHSFQPHHFQRDIRLPRVDVTKFDGSDPTVGSHKWNIISLSTTLQMTWPNSSMVFSI
jgi:hypothetical protein